jgi:dGTPase
VLYSAAFGRLGGVTQVFQAAEGQTYHNRLTHSLKVAQIGRRLAEGLLRRTAPNDVIAAGGLDPDVAETASLCHDLGHPPFGHAAEEALNRKVGEKNGGFEGNAQSFRLLCALVIKNDKQKGLNLTRASLAAVLKYPWLRGENGDYSNVKWGAYDSERDDFVFARNGASDFRKSLEAEIMDWADDVTYSVHDLDDCYRSSLIPLDRLLNDRDDERSKFLRFIERLDERAKPSPADAEKTLAELFNDVLRAILVPRYDLDLPFIGNRAQRAGLSAMTSILISRYVTGLLVTPNDLSRLTIPSQLKDEVWLLKKLMKYYVFESPALVGQQVGQCKLVEDLFDIFLDAVGPQNKIPRGIVPYPFREQIDELKTDAECARFACDIVASMTEQQALLMHKRLTGIEPGSVLDSILR